MRIFAFLLSALLLALSLGYAFQADWATSTWMWEDGRLSYIFVASMIAAMAAGIFWVAYKEEWKAAFSGGLNWVVSFLFMGIALFRSASNPELSGLMGYATGFIAAAVGAAGFMFWTRGFTLKDTRPIPKLVRYSFVVFIAVLIPVSLGLLFQYPYIFPWPLKPESSVLFGSLFLGSALYFIYGYLNPYWGIASGQLLAFLAYDLILIIPYIKHFTAVKPDHFMSLVIYLVVILYSGILSTYYLFIDPKTRITG